MYLGQEGLHLQSYGPFGGGVLGRGCLSEFVKDLNDGVFFLNMMLKEAFQFLILWDVMGVVLFF